MRALGYVLLFAFFLFLPAGTFHWPQAWILLAVLLAVRLWSDFHLHRQQAELMKERAKGPVQEGQPLADRVLVLAFMATYSGLIAFASADRWRWHLLPEVPFPLEILGLAAFVAGWLLVHAALSTNAFATYVVRHQGERGQTVVDAGPYRFVRHPMYAGLVLVMVGLALWLGSAAALGVVLVPTGVLAARIVIEERMLRAKLPEYAAFAGRVRHRLVPGVW